jgi:hypothetical protein
VNAVLVVVLTNHDTYPMFGLSTDRQLGEATLQQENDDILRMVAVKTISMQRQKHGGKINSLGNLVHLQMVKLENVWDSRGH